MTEEQTKLTFNTDYNVHKNKNLSLIVTVMNAMKATIAVHRNTSQIRFVGPIFDRVSFDNLGQGSDWENEELIIVAWVTDIVPQSERMILNVEIDGGSAPKLEQLYKIPSKDGETVVFVGKFRIH